MGYEWNLVVRTPNIDPKDAWITLRLTPESDVFPSSNPENENGSPILLKNW